MYLVLLFLNFTNFGYLKFLLLLHLLAHLYAHMYDNLKVIPFEYKYWCLKHFCTCSTVKIVCSRLAVNFTLNRIRCIFSSMCILNFLWKKHSMNCTFEVYCCLRHYKHLKCICLLKKLQIIIMYVKGWTYQEWRCYKHLKIFLLLCLFICLLKNCRLCMWRSGPIRSGGNRRRSSFYQTGTKRRWDTSSENARTGNGNTGENYFAEIFKFIFKFLTFLICLL